MDSPPVPSFSPRSLLRQRDLEQARRLGRWETAEDWMLVRQHQARQLLGRAGRTGALSLLVAAWFVPVLWPFALVGSLRAFPRTTCRLALALLASGALSLGAFVLVVAQLSRPAPLPAAPPVPTLAPGLTPLDPGRAPGAPASPTAAFRSPG